MCSGLFSASDLFDRSTPSISKAMNEWTYTSIPPMFLHDVDRDSCYLFYLQYSSRRIRWTGYVERMGEERGFYIVLVGKPEGKGPTWDTQA
jgi:hypothetical protein